MNEPNENIELPLISIGITTYNRPEELQRTLRCIAKQTYQNLEIIVSENPSAANGFDLVKDELVLRDKRIRYFLQSENIGGTNNFQFVLDHANGEFFMWMADDDWRELDFVEELYCKLSADSSAVVAFCDFDARDQEGRLIQGYPEFLQALKSMCESSTYLRLVRQFLMKEGTAKPHPIYGLMRKEVLDGFLWDDFINRYGVGSIDKLFVFWLMTKGRLVISERRLAGFTVGNTKDYCETARKWTMSIFLRFMGEQLKYLWGYVRIAQGPAKLTMLILFPWKVLELMYMYVFKPVVNVAGKKYNMLRTIGRR